MICQFAGTVNPYNSLCNSCPDYLETCVPIHSANGYAKNSECDLFFCEGCHVQFCPVDTERDRTAKPIHQQESKGEMKNEKLSRFAHII